MVLGLDLGPHAAFIEIAYGIAVAVLAALILWVVADHRQQARRLAELEARGNVRRPERNTGVSGKVESGYPPESATLPPP
jgi:heme exporter protein CcmD